MQQVRAKDASGATITAIHESDRHVAIILEGQEYVLFRFERDEEDYDHCYITDGIQADWIEDHIEDAYQLKLVSPQEYNKFKKDKEKRRAEQEEQWERSHLSYLKKKYEKE